jgi:hypothetical protein
LSGKCSSFIAYPFDFSQNFFVSGSRIDAVGSDAPFKATNQEQRMVFTNACSSGLPTRQWFLAKVAKWTKRMSYEIAALYKDSAVL